MINKLEIKEWNGHKGKVLASVNGFDVIDNKKRGFAHIIPVPTADELENVYNTITTKRKNLCI